jgi:transposase InsO family protein
VYWVDNRLINAAMESWNHIKVEAIHEEKLPTTALIKNHVFEYIEKYYNRKQLHSTIGYKTPESARG